MKKLLAVAGLLAVSFSSNAGWGTFSIYNYLNASGQVVGTLYDPCFNRPNVVVGTVTSTKVHVETGTCA